MMEGVGGLIKCIYGNEHSLGLSFSAFIQKLA